MNKKIVKQMITEMFQFNAEMADNSCFVLDVIRLKGLAQHLSIAAKKTVAQEITFAHYHDDDVFDAMDFIDYFAFEWELAKCNISELISLEFYQEALYEIDYLLKKYDAPIDWCADKIGDIANAMTEEDK